MELKLLDDESRAKRELEHIKHEYHMKRIEDENVRVSMFLVFICLTIGLFALAGTTLLCVGRLTEGSVLVGACAVSGLAAVLNNAKNRPAKK